MQELWVRYLAGELRSHIHSQGRKNKGPGIIGEERWSMEPALNQESVTCLTLTEHEGPCGFFGPHLESCFKVPLSPATLMECLSDEASKLPYFKISLSDPSVQFNSVAQSCPTICDPMNRSTPGLPVHHPLPEFTQTHDH